MRADRREFSRAGAGLAGLAALLACRSQRNRASAEGIVVAQAAGLPPSTSDEPGTMDWLPNCRLTTHEGREVRFYDDLVRGRIVLVNFMYTKCDGI